MPKVLESSFKKKVNKTLDKIPGLFHFTKEALALRGLPDKFICYKGYFIAWELKKSYAESLKPREGYALQKHTLSLIASAGGIARIVYPENFQECLEEILSLK